jgi:hypothetical protein
MDYPGKVITKNQVTPTQTSATGVWTLDDAAAATRNNNWPVAGVPNPISKSLRFNSADSAYLNRTPASAGNRKTWTWSGWVKRSTLDSSATYAIFDVQVDANNWFTFAFRNDAILYDVVYSGTRIALSSTAIYRDPSAWYHLVVAADTTNATAANRIRGYINGVEVSLNSYVIGSGYVPQNTDMAINTTSVHSIGRRNMAIPDLYLPSYLTEVNFIDGQALTPSSFGMTDPVTGVWEPLKYSGTYGTNGFYLNFKDATSTTTLGLDYSGNSNTWTTNNFSVTAGAGNDSLTDVPTPWIVYNTTGDVGGVVRGNYATWNPLSKGANTTLANGNLDASYTTANSAAGGTIAVSSGKWYWEVTSSGSANDIYGICSASESVASLGYPGATATSYGYLANGLKYNNASSTAYGASFTTNDVIGVALDLDAGTLVYYKNGSSQGTAFSSLSGTFIPAIRPGLSATTVTNFGQRPFAYTPPSGFLSLCTTNLPASTVLKGSEYMNVALYTGTGSSLGVTGVGFQPDWVWIKGRSGATDHGLYDVLRGVQNQVESNSTGAETAEATGLTAFGSDGFTVGALAQLNTSSATYVAWNWGANGAGVSNTAGTITATVSANTTAGFSIVTYTGNGIDGATVGHGLGVVPSMVIQKRRDGGIANFRVWHSAIYATSGVTDTLFLNSTAASGPDADNISGVSSTTFTTRGTGGTNPSGNGCVAYVFAAISGFSAFGSYTGNGSTDGPFVYLGFRPRFVLFKSTSGPRNWAILDSGRNPSNVANFDLYPNQSLAEVTQSTVDFLSNGFKLRVTDSDFNQAETYIFAAFAENPFKNALAR